MQTPGINPTESTPSPVRVNGRSSKFAMDIPVVGTKVPSLFNVCFVFIAVLCEKLVKGMKRVCGCQRNVVVPPEPLAKLQLLPRHRRHLHSFRLYTDKLLLLFGDNAVFRKVQPSVLTSTPPASLPLSDEVEDGSAPVDSIRGAGTDVESSTPDDVSDGGSNAAEDNAEHRRSITMQEKRYAEYLERLQLGAAARAAREAAKEQSERERADREQQGWGRLGKAMNDLFKLP